MKKIQNTSDFKSHIFVVILCGGGGTRVWPLSISKKPKQFLKFYSDKTLFQETIARAEKLTSFDHIIVITNSIYRDEVKLQDPRLQDKQIIAEPIKRNTALAMGVAAAYVYHLDPQAVIINLASDHVIVDKQRYVQTLHAGSQIAYDRHILMAIGILPTFAHAGLGYIHKGEALETIEDLPLSKVVGFKEKPTVEVAQQFLDSGEYLWNANNYIWRADDILAEFDKLSTTIAKHIRNIQEVWDKPNFEEVFTQQYNESPEEQIDTAISEKTDKLYVLPGDFGWNDVGGWQVVYELGQKDEQQNVLIRTDTKNEQKPIILEEANGNLIYANKQPIAILGLSNIVVVDTGIGLLVCDRSRSNDVKKIVQKLQAQGHNDLI